MNEVKRWGWGHAGMLETPSNIGNYVEYSDYAVLKAERDSARRKTLDDLARTEIDEGLYDKVPLVIPTPINELLDACARECGVQSREFWFCIESVQRMGASANRDIADG